jgi:hypothetical protein
MIFFFWPFLALLYVVGYIIWGVLWGMFYAAVLLIKISSLLAKEVRNYAN